MSNASDDDNEWEKRHLEYEAHVDELSKSLRVCAIHGNPASINSGYESELSILADPCGCWLQAEYYDSIDECVEAWNKQPRIDAMQATIAALRERIATLEAEQWTPVAYQKIPGDDPMYIKDGVICSMDWETWEGNPDEWTGDWEDDESVLAAMRPWGFGGDVRLCRRKGSEGEVANGE